MDLEFFLKFTTLKDYKMSYFDSKNIIFKDIIAGFVSNFFSKKKYTFEKNKKNYRDEWIFR